VSSKTPESDAPESIGPELPPVERVSCDACVVTVKGKPYHIHRGQYVEYVGVNEIGELQAAWDFNRLSVKFDAVKGEAQEGLKRLAILDEHYDQLLEWMAERLVDWDWTDQRGRPLPKPDGTAGPLRKLTPEEILFLDSVLSGEVPAEGKNADAVPDEPPA